MRECVSIKLSLSGLNWILSSLSWALRRTCCPSKMNSYGGVWPTYCHQFLIMVVCTCLRGTEKEEVTPFLPMAIL